MSNEKYKLHPATVFISTIKAVKVFILPMIIILVTSGFKFNFDFRSDAFFKDSIAMILFFIVFIGITFTTLLKWWTYRYWFEDRELRIEYGLFVKKKRYIPFDRIQNLNYKESVLHRVFGLVQVIVETAGAKSDEPEADLTAIKKAAADQIELEMKQVKRTDGAFEVEPSVQVVHSMSTRDLLIVATTSNSMGVVLVGVYAAISQFAEYISFEAIYNELSYLVRFGFMVVMSMVFVVLLVVWLISVFLTAINYYRFTIMQDGERLIITRGLLEKKRISLPKNRIQAIKIIENPLRQLLGLCTVVVESAGGNFSGESDKKIVLMPIISRKKMYPLLAELFPEFQFIENEKVRSPLKARVFFYRLNFFFIVPIVAALSYFFYPYGLLSILIVFATIALGVWQHKTAALQISNQQLMIRYRQISRITFFAQKPRIQMVEASQNYFQKRKAIASAKIIVMSGMNGASAKAFHMDLHEIKKLLAWYEAKK